MPDKVITARVANPLKKVFFTKTDTNFIKHDKELIFGEEAGIEALLNMIYQSWDMKRDFVLECGKVTFLYQRGV